MVGKVNELNSIEYFQNKIANSIQIIELDSYGILDT